MSKRGGRRKRKKQMFIHKVIFVILIIIVLCVTLFFVRKIYKGLKENQSRSFEKTEGLQIGESVDNEKKKTSEYIEMDKEQDFSYMLGYSFKELKLPKGITEFVVDKGQESSNIIPGYVCDVKNKSKRILVTISMGIEGIDDGDTFNLPDLIGENFEFALSQAEEKGFYIGKTGNGSQIIQMKYLSEKLEDPQVAQVGDCFMRGTAILLIMGNLE